MRVYLHKLNLRITPNRDELLNILDKFWCPTDVCLCYVELALVELILDMNKKTNVKLLQNKW